MTESETNNSQSSGLSLFLISVFGLYLELLVIRWIGTEVRIFAYLQNTVLVVCFLGLGIGCLNSHRPFVLRHLLIPLSILVFLFAVPFTRRTLGNISELLSSLRDFVIFSPWLTNNPLDVVSNVSVGLCFTFALMILLLEMFIPIGRLLGRLIDSHPNIIAGYSINIAGSLVGIWLFSILSAFSLSPFGWFICAAVLLLYFLFKHSDERALNGSLIALTLAFSWFASIENNALELHWSPYQKLALSRSDLNDAEYGEYTINVNNATFQEMINLSEEHVSANPEAFPKELRRTGQYDIPYRFHPSPAKILIVGAGSGNDVSAALRAGATDITAVDIDPVIIDIGRRYHPEKPYSSPKVSVVTDDARSFFATTADTYDMVVFGLLDSHAVTSMTNARLDHYVYTRESIERAKTLLKPGGVIVLSFYSITPFITDRFERTLRTVFSEAPIVFKMGPNNYGRGGTVFVTGDFDVIRSQMEQHADLSDAVEALQSAYPMRLSGTTEIATDNWPYIYLEHRKIPTLYYLLALLLAVLLIYCNTRLGLKKIFSSWNRSHWHFFFLGAAFLLEVQNISKASVVLGNTWQVNGVIISGILIMILLSNLIAYLFPKIPVFPAYLGIFITCVALYFIDLSQFAFLPYATKAIIVGLLTTLPMLFSGLVFIRSFAATEAKDLALGANLLGALIGGLLQSVTFITGIKALLLIVALLHRCDVDATKSRLIGTAVPPDASPCLKYTPE